VPLNRLYACCVLCNITGIEVIKAAPYLLPKGTRGQEHGVRKAKRDKYLMLRSSLVLLFLCEYVMGIRHLLWLRASAYGFIHTNEERSTSTSLRWDFPLDY